MKEGFARSETESFRQPVPLGATKQRMRVVDRRAEESPPQYPEPLLELFSQLAASCVPEPPPPPAHVAACTCCARGDEPLASELELDRACVLACACHEITGRLSQKDSQQLATAARLALAHVAIRRRRGKRGMVAHLAAAGMQPHVAALVSRGAPVSRLSVANARILAATAGLPTPA